MSVPARTENNEDDLTRWARTDRPIYVNGRFLTQHITGVQRYAHEIVLAFDSLLEEAKRAGLDPRIVVLTPPRGVIHHHDTKHVEFRAVGRLTGYPWEQFELPGYARDGILFCPGNTAPVLRLWAGRTTVVTLHDVGFNYLPKSYSRAFRTVYRLMIPIVLRRSSIVITVSQAEADNIRNYNDAAGSRLIVIQNGSFGGDKIFEGPDVALDQDPPFALYVGAINTKKNVQGVLAAARLLKDERIEFRIVGGGAPAFSDIEQILGHEIGENVQFTGRISDEKLVEYYRSAVCLALPSYYEASPIPPMEAMACGCPVVTSNIASFKERCGDAALHCDPDNIEEIADAVRRLLTDKRLRTRQRKRGYARAREFTWVKCARRTLDVIAAAG